MSEENEKEKKYDKEFFRKHLKDMILKENSILSQEEIENLRKKIREDRKAKLTTREILYLEHMHHENRLVIMMIFNFLKTIEKQIKMLYQIWAGRDDSEIESELVEFRNKTLKGYNQVKIWMKERKSPWFLVENIPKVMPKLPESFKQKLKKMKKIKKR